MKDKGKTKKVVNITRQLRGIHKMDKNDDQDTNLEPMSKEQK